MSLLSWHRWTLLGCLTLLAGSVATAGQPNPAVAPALDAATLIRRVQDASLQRSFTGTFVISTGAQMSSSRITHFGDGRDQVELIESLDGRMRKVYRHNDEVHVLWPQARRASIEHREAIQGFPTTFTTSGGPVLDRYEIQREPDGRIAGHAAQIVLLRPADEFRYAQRWWLERDTGLLLRTDLLAPNGEILESSAYSTLDFGVHGSSQALLQEMRRTDGYQVSHPTVAPTNLYAEGWVLASTLPGFQAVRCVRRPIYRAPHLDAPASATAPATLAHPVGSAAASAAAASKAAGDGVVQVIFSDGLTHVSIFIEPYQAGSTRTQTQIAMGATTAVTQRHGDWWITAIGDVPALTLHRFADALDRHRP